MARISTYANDTSVSSTDKFLGSNIDGTVKNFRVSDITHYLRSTNSAGVGGQLVYVYQDGTLYTDGSRNSGTLTLEPDGGVSVAFSGLSSIKISKYTNGSSDSVSNFISTLLDVNVIISNTDDQGSFGVYNVSAINQDSQETNFYDLSLTLVGSLSSGNMVTNKSYAINVFTAGDKTYISNQLNFSAGVSQTITHNLGKFPSVTVVSSNGNEVVGDIQHTSINTLKVTFENNFAAKVYVN